MLEVSKKVLTDFGARCQAQAMAGRKITFTVFQLGAGEYTGNETVAELMEATALKEKKQEFGISKMELSEAADTVILTLIAINSSVNIGYNIREIGVFARDANGTQGLYSLCVAKPDKADWMPAYNGIDPVTLVYRDYLRIGNTENVLIDLNSEGLVSTKIFEETVTELREEMENPEFEDYSGENAEVPDARTAIAGITSKKSIFKILSNVKAALMGVVTLGEMRALLVNNGLCTEAGKYFLDAAYGKTLQDQIAQQNSDLAPYGYLNWTPTNLVSGGACYSIHDSRLCITQLSTTLLKNTTGIPYNNLYAFTLFKVEGNPWLLPASSGPASSINVGTIAAIAEITNGSIPSWGTARVWFDGTTTNLIMSLISSGFDYNIRFYGACTWRIIPFAKIAHSKIENERATTTKNM